MKLVLVFLFPASIVAQCWSPRNTHSCPQLMLEFSRTAGFNRQSSCFNFCDGVFQNSNSFYFGSWDCVTGCRLSDLPANVAPATTSTYFTTATSGTQAATAPVSWWFPGTQINPSVANTAVTTPAYTPYTPYVNRVPGASITGATVTAFGGSGYGTVGSGSVYTPSVYNPLVGRASITQAVVSGPLGTSYGTVTGAGKAIPFARSTNIAGASILRTSSCSGKMGCGKMGGKMGGSRYYSSSRSYEALASSITAPSLTTAAAAAASALLLVV